ncbi:MAG: lipoyl synthase [Deltaproteobacteria bacterium]|jgi:lipoic acid synthetase|nr:lipoyl synthase [Deltaproteobacteria bacterium]
MKKSHLRKPDWIKSKLPGTGSFKDIKEKIRKKKLATVCVEASCPNLGKCWSEGTMTIMILGEVCSRNCRFCDVKSQLEGFNITDPDPKEPVNIANSLAELNSSFAVITSVTRDDLPDQGANHWVEVIREIKKKNIGVEVLVPDFRGKTSLIDLIIKENPEVFAHNIEVVRRLSPEVRPEANYQRSLNVLSHAAQSKMTIKSSLMLGMGETQQEIIETMSDLQKAGTQILTLGQYLAPSRKHHRVEKYYTPEHFAEFQEIGEKMGFSAVKSGPLVRSSFQAKELYEKIVGIKK